MRTLKLFIAAILISTAIHAQQSTIYENKSFHSDKLQREVNYALYLPASYNTSDKAYPVLYLLHGGSGSHVDWVRNGTVQQIADQSIAAGESIEMIIVMPDAWNTWYANGTEPNSNYEDMFINELIPYIEANYRTITQKSYRAIAGLSMGGFGALNYTLHHPDLFGITCAYSPAVRTDNDITEMEQNTYDNRFHTLFGTKGKAGNARLNAAWRRYDVLTQVREFPEADRRKLNIHVYCGDDDYLYPGNTQLWGELNKARIPFQFRVLDGAHTWSFCRMSLRETLPIISAQFTR
jgi:S-formylglutathione hydrolase FrmB